jgi:hypothetical protein
MKKGIYLPSEIDPAIAKERMKRAVMNCEIEKARSTIRALMLVREKGMNGNRSRKNKGV